ncbi:hypothetical protein BASA50_004695 [Batrachochytrium salamandrivorans]|uniref:Reverse transcriptase domain-containing protein n=1 Tax=Batrachochytrium salamandrivorans TaxID=1357716 RepID=A0ABQ8FEV4_9FUNG|nr:hypothetical protein BASA50_004695 [Batrachochytrium salamandrivorans]
MQEWIAENLAKGFIRNSSSPYGAPCFFVKQKDKLRLCMDYRGLNKQTVKDRNPIPLISEMLRTYLLEKSLLLWISVALIIYFELRRATNQKRLYYKIRTIRISGNAFRFSNAPAQFQRMMNSLFRHMISKFVLVYLDDIVVYSET